MTNVIDNNGSSKNPKKNAKNSTSGGTTKYITTSKGNTIYQDLCLKGEEIPNIITSAKVSNNTSNIKKGVKKDKSYDRHRNYNASLLNTSKDSKDSNKNNTSVDYQNYNLRTKESHINKYLDNNFNQNYQKPIELLSKKSTEVENENKKELNKFRAHIDSLKNNTNSHAGNNLFNSRDNDRSMSRESYHSNNSKHSKHSN